MTLCLNSLYGHKVFHWLLLFILLAILIEPCLIRGLIIIYQITPHNVHYNCAV